MGKSLIDRFTYLHFAMGIVVYYWNMSLPLWLTIHTLFEIIENSKPGVSFIDNYITLWPGGKKYPDSFINSVGDTIAAIVGWLSAFILHLRV